MKITTNQIFSAATGEMAEAQARLAKTQVQLAQGKQVVKPSDAPSEASAIQRLKAVIDRQDGYLRTISLLDSRYRQEEAVLEGVSESLMRFEELALQAANDTQDALGRQAIAIEMRGLRDNLLDLVNTQDSDGHYLFAGGRNTLPAYETDESGEFTYAGDRARMKILVGDGRTVQVNRSGADTFQRAIRTEADGTSVGVDFFQSIEDLIVATEAGDNVAMSRGVNEIDQLHGGIVLARAQIGSDMKRLDSQRANLDETMLNLKTTLSEIEDLDYASAITKMNQQLLSLEAAQGSFAKISQLSLFNYIN